MVQMGQPFENLHGPQLRRRRTQRVLLPSKAADCLCEPMQHWFADVMCVFPTMFDLADVCTVEFDCLVLVLATMLTC